MASASPARRNLTFSRTAAISLRLIVIGVSLRLSALWQLAFRHSGHDRTHDGLGVLCWAVILELHYRPFVVSHALDKQRKTNGVLRLRLAFGWLCSLRLDVLPYRRRYDRCAHRCGEPLPKLQRPAVEGKLMIVVVPDGNLNR